MFDQPQAAMQRARGRATVDFSAGRLVGLSQSGSAKVMLPSVHSAVPEAVFLNTAGGLTGGDRFEFEASVEGGALTLTTQTAERAYASTGPAAEVDIRLKVGAGATLHWLPQETILFDRSSLARRTVIDAAPGARVLALEMVVFGRAAMGENLTRFELFDRREINVEGPVWVDALAMDETLLGSAAGLGGARAIGTLILWDERAEDIARGFKLPEGLAISAWEGRLVIRGAYRDLWPLKSDLAPVIRQLCAGDLPRVWAI
ncbi:MAG: urease accessory protein UreD [Pseudomonadota bacterium]